MTAGWSCVVYKRGERVLARARTGRIISSSTDAGEVIRRALEHAAGRGGGEVLIREGTYLLATTATLRDASNVVVRGMGSNVTRLLRKGPATIFHLINVSNFSLRDLWLDGGGVGNQILDIFVQPKHYGYGNILVERCKIGHNLPAANKWGVTVWGYEGWTNPNALRKVTFRDCLFYDMPSRKGRRRPWDQVTFSGVTDVLLERCVLRNVNMVYFMMCHRVTMRNCALRNGHRITVDGGEDYRFENLTGNELDYIHLHGCEKRPVKGVVISGGNIRVLGFAWTTNVVVENLTILGKRAMPIRVDGPEKRLSNFVIRGCTIWDCQAPKGWNWSIACRAPHSEIAGNTISGQGRMRGILVGGDFCTVEGNVVRDVLGPGIVLRNVKGCTVRGNTILFPTAEGVLCENVKDCKIVGNIILGARGRKVGLVGKCEGNVVEGNL